MCTSMSQNPIDSFRHQAYMYIKSKGYAIKVCCMLMGCALMYKHIYTSNTLNQIKSIGLKHIAQHSHTQAGASTIVYIDIVNW